MASNRRNFIRTVTSSALAIPLIPSMGIAEKMTGNKVPPMPKADDPKYWDKLRDQFLLSDDKVFFNTGTLGAMPKVAVNRMVEHIYKVATDIADWDYRDGDRKSGEWMSGYWPHSDIREKLAKLINADLKEVALTENVTTAMSYFANGLDLKAGDEVITSDQEHPGGRGAWLVKQKRYNVTFREVALPKPAHNPGEIVDILVNAITPRTRAIMISHVITGSGAILPVKEICSEARKRGIITILDGAQSLGHVDVDVKDIGCDAYVGCFHKWILAPAGTGFLYIRNDRIKDIWTTIASSQWDNQEDGGYRFTQKGTGNLSVLLALDASLDFHFAIGPEKVRNRIKFLGNHLRTELRKIQEVKIYAPEDESMCAGITVYNIDGYTGPKLQDEFWSRARMRPRSSSDVFGVRHCTHIYNSIAEIDKALDIVRELAKTGVAPMSLSDNRPPVMMEP